MVVHGIPGPYELKRGDILSLDVGVVKNGWVADGAVTLPIGPVTEEARDLLTTTEASLFAGIEKAVAGNHLGDISAAIQERVERDGFSIIRNLVGHGIGRDMHEEPADPELRQARRGPPPRGGHGPRDRAHGQRRRPRASAWATTAGPSTPRTSPSPRTSSSRSR